MKSLVVFVAVGASGCMLDLWAGGYAVQQPGGTSPAVTVGASFGAYLDPVKTRTRVGVGLEAGRTWNTSDSASTLDANGAQVRVDVGLGPSQRSAYDTHSLKRLTAIFTYRGEGTSNIMRSDPMAAEQPSDRMSFYAGYGKELVQNPGRLWRDTISVSVGPTYGRWTGGDTGDVSMFGVQAHVTLAFSPLVVFAILGNAGRGVKEVAKSTTPNTTAPSSSSSTPSSAGCYYADKCDVNQKNCKPVWTCP